jgi:hypothetical protein
MKKSSSKRMTKTKKTLIVVVTGIIVGVTSGVILMVIENFNTDLRTKKESVRETKVTIENLTKGDLVEPIELVRGNIWYLPSTEKVWLVVYAPEQNKYHPQCEVKINGNEWQGTGNFGRSEDTGKPYDLKIVTIKSNSRTETRFNNYLTNGKRTGLWPGIDLLPTDARVLKEVNVQRK